jgi:hypothetical protein
MERYREKESRGAHDGMLWRLVDAPDIEYWGRITCLTEGDIEIGAKLGSIAQGSKFVKFTQPSVVGVVRGKRLEVR